MSTQYLYAENFIFTSRKGNGTVNLLAGAGETLNIGGTGGTGGVIGNPTQVAYNNNNVMTGSDSLRFFDGDFYTDTVDTDKVRASKTRNELSLALTTDPAAKAGNTDIVGYGTGSAIANDGTNVWAFIQSPYDEIDGSVKVYKNGSALTNLAYQSLYTGNSVDVQMCCNDDGTRVYFTDSSMNGGVVDNSYFNYYTRSGDTFTYGTQGRAYRVSCWDKYLTVSYKTTDYLAIRDMALSTTQVIYSGTGSTSIRYHAMSTNTMAVCYDTYLKIFKLSSGTWSLAQTFIMPITPTSLDLKGNIMVLGSASAFYIYERTSSTADFSLSTNFTGSGLVKTVTDGTNVLAVSSSVITSYVKYIGVWTLVSSTTSLSYAPASVDACSGYIIIGQTTYPSYGGATYYVVNPFIKTLSSIDLTSVITANNNFYAPDVFCSGGVSAVGGTFTGDVGITGALSCGYITSSNSFGLVYGNSSAQTIPRNTTTEITSYFNDTPYIVGDTSGLRPSFSGGRWYVNKTGVYKVEATVNVYPTNAGRIELYIIRGGSFSEIYDVDQREVGTLVNRITMHVSAILAINASDYVSIWINADQDGLNPYVTFDSAVKGHFTIYRL